MEQLTTDKINQVLKPLAPASVTAPMKSAALMSLKQPSQSVIEKGVNALDLIDSPVVSPVAFKKAIGVLQSNYGTEYAPEKAALLFDMIRDDGWSEHRFSETLRWFLRNKPFAAWTIADWFSFSIPVFPYEWTIGKSEYESYELPNGTVVYKPKDGRTLPFPEAKLKCLSCGEKHSRSSGHKWNFCKEDA